MKIKKHKSKINIKDIRKAKMYKEKMVHKIAEFLEMPEELVGDNTKITLVDNKYLYLEGNNTIEDYYDHYIKKKMNTTDFSENSRERSFLFHPRKKLNV